MKKRSSIVLVLGLVLGSCFYDKEEELYGLTPACETGVVTYSGTVNSLLQQYGCLGCHGSPAPSGNVNLQGHANAQAIALSGRLFGAISHSPGFKAMPQGGNKMNACDIKKIKAWIDAGAPNN